MTKDEFNGIGVSVAALLVKTKLCKTKSEARRMIKQGAIKLSDIKISDPFARVVMNGNTVNILEFCSLTSE